MQQEHQEAAQAERLIRLPEVKHRTGLGKSAIYEGMATGTFPICIKFGRASMWPLSRIDAWIADRIREGMQASGTMKPLERTSAETLV